MLIGSSARTMRTPSTKELRDELRAATKNLCDRSSELERKLGEKTKLADEKAAELTAAVDELRVASQAAESSKSEAARLQARVESLNEENATLRDRLRIFETKGTTNSMILF